MFFDSREWPPAPGGSDPSPNPEPRLTPRQERYMLRVIGVFLFLMFVGPLAGSSVILAVIAALRSAFS